MRKLKSDGWFSIVLLLFTIFMYQQTYEFPKEAALFPRIFAALLGVLAIVLLVKSLMEKEDKTEKKQRNYKTPVLIVFGLAIYALVLNFTGYIIATILLVSYVIYVLGYKDFKKILLTSVVGVAVAYVVFKVVLGVQLPEIFFMA